MCSGLASYGPTRQRYVGAAWERWQKEPEEDETDDEADGKDAESGDAKALADIEEYGLHVISVTGDGDAPPFSCSIGIFRALQIICPDREGVFPWEPQARQEFRDWQPLLAVSAAA